MGHKGSDVIMTCFQYEVTVSSPGFIDSVFTLYIECLDDGSCTEANKFVSMSPELAPGQTRIMLTWAYDTPSDLDIHIMAVNKVTNDFFNGINEHID